MVLRILCIITACYTVIGRLPPDETAINIFTKYEGHIISSFDGVHDVVQVEKDFYISCKNQVFLLQIVSEADSQAAKHRVHNVINWPSTPTANKLCKQKTRHEKLCNNFIRIVAPKNESGAEFIVCGTNSFQPSCRSYFINNGSFLKNYEFSGTSICPYDPRHTAAFIYTGDYLYSATVSDFLGRKPIIYRYANDDISKNLERTKREDTWLNDPKFINLIDAGLKVYIFFTESAVEDESGLSYSRVAQLCKNDQGGDHILRKQFTSYQKARLNCSFPGQPPFYFNEISSVSDFVTLPDMPGEKIIFATMNTPKNSIWGSAVCAYLKRDIEYTFTRPFLERRQHDSMSYWAQRQADKAVNDVLSRCEYDTGGARPTSLSDENMQFIRAHPFKSDSVPSWSGQKLTGFPLFMKLNSIYQFSAITVDNNAGSTGLNFVILVGTTDGRMLKLIPKLSPEVTSYSESFQFVEETFVYSETNCGPANTDEESSVISIKIDKNSGSILVGFASCIISVPMCPVSSTCQRVCIAAQDPYCAWDGESCVTVVKPEGLEQDIANGDVTGLPYCVPVAVAGKSNNSSGFQSGQIGNVDKDLDSKRTSPRGNENVTGSTRVAVSPSNPTVNSHPVIAGIWPPAFVGFGIGVAIMVVIGLLCCLRKKCYPRAEKFTVEETTEFPSSERPKSIAEFNRRSQDHTKSTLLNHTQNDDKSEAVDETADLFLDPQVDKSRNLYEKPMSAGDKENNRRSEASYHTQDSNEQANQQNAIGRQISRESNSSELPAPRDEKHSLDHRPQQPVFQRTFSMDNAGTMTQKPYPSRHVLRRNLSLQIPQHNVNMQQQQFLQNVTPGIFRKQNPLDIYNQKQAMKEIHSHPTMPSWHPSQVKNTQDLPRNLQTASLDRKASKSRSFALAQQAHSHEAQQVGKHFSDTFPSQMKEDLQGPSRKRYQSESMGLGVRAPPLYFASKHPLYTSIEEENSAAIDQSPSQHSPTAIMPGHLTRPNNLPLKTNGQHPQDSSNQFMNPYSNPNTPMTEHPPFHVQSPIRVSGYTLPSHPHRQHSEILQSKYNTRQPMPSYTMNTQRSDPFRNFDSPQGCASEFPKTPTKNEKQSRSNPSTPEWDAEHNNYFSTSGRNRNASGKSQGASPSTEKAFLGFGHPEVITPRGTNDVNEMNTRDKIMYTDKRSNVSAETVM